MERPTLVSFLVFIGVGLAIALSPAPQSKPTPPTTKHRSQPDTLSTSIEAVAATPTPTPEPTPSPTPDITWRDNPQGCNELTQWIALEPPHYCIDKPRPTVARIDPVSTPDRPGGDKYSWMTSAGIPQSDWQYVDYIVSRESGWSHTAVNPTSFATGLCQSLPAFKMATAGSDYLTNPVTQLRWCHSYATQRYRGWANAYAFWLTNHWW